MNKNKNRHFESSDEEPIQVTWKPTCELEELRDKLPTLIKHIKEFEAQADEPDLSLPTADRLVDNLERQCFDVSDKFSPCTQKTGRTAK